MGVGTVLGELLPVAMGVAISPVPVIASVLMLLSARPGRTAPAFAVGWVVGLTAVTVIVLLVAPSDDGDEPSTATSWIKLVLGLVVLGLAVATWRRRPPPGVDAPTPKWMAGIDAMQPGNALALGAALSGANPKNLALAITAGVTIAAGDLDAAATTTCVAVFVLLGSVLVAGPVVAHFVAKDAMAAPLATLKTFMQDHNTAIMTVLLTTLALSNIGKGLGGLIDG